MVGLGVKLAFSFDSVAVVDSFDRVDGDRPGAGDGSRDEFLLLDFPATIEFAATADTAEAARPKRLVMAGSTVAVAELSLALDSLLDGGAVDEARNEPKKSPPVRANSCCFAASNPCASFGSTAAGRGDFDLVDVCADADVAVDVGVSGFGEFGG